VEMGEIATDRLWAMKDGDGRERKRIIYDVVPRYIDGIGVRDDPLIEMRTAVYLMSGRNLREADHVA
jgi:catalase